MIIGVEAMHEAVRPHVDKTLRGNVQGVAVQSEVRVCAQPTPGQRIEPQAAAYGDVAHHRQSGSGAFDAAPASEQAIEHQSRS